MTTTRSISLDRKKEKCNECNLEPIIISCNKCANSVCKQCAWEFPHYYNAIFCLCKSCFDSIDNKLILLLYVEGKCIDTVYSKFSFKKATFLFDL